MSQTDEDFEDLPFDPGNEQNEEENVGEEGEFGGMADFEEGEQEKIGEGEGGGEQEEINEDEKQGEGEEAEGQVKTRVEEEEEESIESFAIEAAEDQPEEPIIVEMMEEVEEEATQVEEEAEEEEEDYLSNYNPDEFLSEPNLSKNGTLPMNILEFEYPFLQ